MLRQDLHIETVKGFSPVMDYLSCRAEKAVC